MRATGDVVGVRAHLDVLIQILLPALDERRRHGKKPLGWGQCNSFAGDAAFLHQLAKKPKTRAGGCDSPSQKATNSRYGVTNNEQLNAVTKHNSSGPYLGVDVLKVLVRAPDRLRLPFTVELAHTDDFVALRATKPNQAVV